MKGEKQEHWLRTILDRQKKSNSGIDKIIGLLKVFKK